VQQQTVLFYSSSLAGALTVADTDVSWGGEVVINDASGCNAVSLLPHQVALQQQLPACICAHHI
jgi:hypothetical protein